MRRYKHHTLISFLVSSFSRTKIFVVGDNVTALFLKKATDPLCLHFSFLFLSLYVPAGWPGSSLRVASNHELEHLYLKKKNKWAPSRPFALRRSSQLARNTKETRNCIMLSMTETVWLKPCCPNCLVLSANAPSRTIRVFPLYVYLRTRLKLMQLWKTYLFRAYSCPIYRWKTRVYLCVACYYLGFLGEGPCAAIFRILAYLAHGLPLSGVQCITLWPLGL